MQVIYLKKIFVFFLELPSFGKNEENVFFYPIPQTLATRSFPHGKLSEKKKLKAVLQFRVNLVFKTALRPLIVCSSSFVLIFRTLMTKLP